jgi:hypothetical protein
LSPTAFEAVTFTKPPALLVVSDFATSSKKKRSETDAGAKPESISVEPDDEPDEGEWGSDYDLPV